MVTKSNICGIIPKYALSVVYYSLITKLYRSKYMEQSGKKVDLRVVKTKKAILKVFAELLSEKNIDDITVKEISERALINRKTFYNYYKGVYQLVDEIEDEVVNTFASAVKGIDLRKQMKDPCVIFEKLTAIINSNIDFYGALLKTIGNISLVYKIKELLKVKAKESFASQISIESDKLEIMMEYVISGMISVYQNWYNSGKKQSLEEISDIVSRMCFTGFAGVIENI